MKRIGILAWILCLYLFPQVAIAAVPLPIPQVGMPAGASRIGVVAAVKGSVEIVQGSKVGRVVDSGAPVFLGDIISTDAEGQLQIMLLDQTIFTIGPNTKMAIDEFVYDPSSDEGVIKARIVEGVFRFITGKIGKKKPENMEVALPVGTLGVRGTIVAGECTQGSAMVALLGPGPQNSAGESQGSFTLNNDVGGQTKTTNVTRTGFGSEIPGPGEAPSAAFKVPDTVIEKLTDDFASPTKGDKKGGNSQEGGAGDGEGSGQGGDSKGEDGGGGPGGLGAHGPGGAMPRSMARSGAFGKGGTGLQLIEALRTALPEGDRPHLPTDLPLDLIRELQSLAPDDATTFEQLRSLADSTLTFTDSAVETTRAGTTFDISVIIDLSIDKLGGGTSKITENTEDIGTFQFNIPNNCASCNFSTGATTGPAGFLFSDIANQDTGMGSCSGCTADLVLAFGNRNTSVDVGDGVDDLAVVMLHTVTINDSGGDELATNSVPLTITDPNDRTVA